MAKHGENIRKRRDGRWEGRYIKGRRPDGTALWGYVYSRSYQDVRKMLLARKAERDNNNVFDFLDSEAGTAIPC